MYVHACMYVRPSTKSLLDFNEIWHVCRGRRVIHGQGQGQGHELFKVGNPAFFKSYLLRCLQW